jgi:hypothetical protein
MLNMLQLNGKGESTQQILHHHLLSKLKIKHVTPNCKAWSEVEGFICPGH